MRVSGRGTGTLYKPCYKGRDGVRRTSGVWRWKLGDRLNVSTGCRDKKLAEAWRVQRLAEMGRGGLVGIKAAALRYEQLEAAYLDAHALEQRRSHPESELKHLRAYFGGWLARDITPDACRRYATKRRAEGYEVATVNLHLARLRRMLRLAWQSGRLPSAPYVPLLPGAKVRRGWLGLGDVAAIVARLPERVRPVVWFLALTGWRLSEALRLEWCRVDREAQEIRLDTSKSGAPRCVPFSTYPPLAALLEEQWKLRTSGAGQPCDDEAVAAVGSVMAATSSGDAWHCGRSAGHHEIDVDSAGPDLPSGRLVPKAGALAQSGHRVLSPWVFPSRRALRRLSKDTVERAWRRAADETGHVGSLLHDLRRSFVRRCELAGMPRQVAMSLTGHASEAVYLRYCITDRTAQQEGLALLSEDAARTKVQRIPVRADA